MSEYEDVYGSRARSRPIFLTELLDTLKSECGYRHQRFEDEDFREDFHADG